MAESPLASVAIPAHNEARVIGRTLEQLGPLAANGTLEVVVSCNGCSDSTADVARRFTGVQVIESGVASKAAALRAADRALATLPRIYLDADVVLPRASALAVARALARPGAVAARPAIRYDTHKSSWLVRQYYSARTTMPAVMTSVWGAGMFALSASARSRFDEFPDVTADDLWIDGLVADDELQILDCPAVAVDAPRRAIDLYRTLRRVQRGKRELITVRSTTGTTVRDLRRVALAGPSGALRAAVYAGFVALARVPSPGRRQATRSTWERDESSRA